MNDFKTVSKFLWLYNCDNIIQKRCIIVVIIFKLNAVKLLCMIHIYTHTYYTTDDHDSTRDLSFFAESCRELFILV